MIVAILWHMKNTVLAVFSLLLGFPAPALAASVVSTDALREWKERRDNHGYTIAELRRLIQEGIDSGPGKFSSIDQIKEEARKRFGQRQRRAS